MSSEHDLSTGVDKRLRTIERIVSYTLLIVTPLTSVFAAIRGDSAGVFSFAVWIVSLVFAWVLLTSHSKLLLMGSRQPLIRSSTVNLVYLVIGLVAGLCLIAKPVWTSLLAMRPPPYCGTSVKYQLPRKVEPIGKATSDHTEAATSGPSAVSAVSSLTESYLKANSELLKQTLALAAEDGSSVLLLATAPAGVGKTFIVKAINSRYRNQVRLVDVTEGRKPGQPFAFPPGTKINMIPDLFYQDEKSGRQVVLNDLPGLGVTEAALEAYLFPTDDQRLLMLDGLDELHPTLSSLILTQVCERLRSGRIHGALIFSRPEGFSMFFRPGKHDQSANINLQKLIVIPPANLRENGVLDEDLIGLRLANHEERYGRHIEPEVVLAFLEKKSWIEETFRNLSWSTSIISTLIDYPDRSDAPDMWWKDNLFKAMLSRAYESHGRPKIDRQDYLNLIEDVAVRYWDEARMDEGYFKIHEFDNNILVVKNGQKVGAVAPYLVLERSGLIWIDPFDNSLRRFRFETAWLHEHLMERWNVRNAPNYQYGTSGWYLGTVSTVDSASRLCWYAIVSLVTVLVLQKARKVRKVQFGTC